MYRIANRRKTRLRHRSYFWLGFTLFFLAIAIWSGLQFMQSLHQKPVIKGSKAKVIKISYEGKVKHYNEGDFSIDIPVTWQKQPRPPYTYQSYSWSTTDKANNVSLEIFEDTIPENLAVNRAMIVSPAGDHLELTGQASENCVQYTANAQPVAGQQGVLAKWQNVSFLCNRITTTRDVIGTSSTDGINTVVLRKSDGTMHKFFFTYTTNQLSPDYTIFYNALATFSMN